MLRNIEGRRGRQHRGRRCMLGTAPAAGSGAGAVPLPAGRMVRGMTFPADDHGIVGIDGQLAIGARFPDHPRRGRLSEHMRGRGRQQRGRGWAVIREKSRRGVSCRVRGGERVPAGRAAVRSCGANRRQRRSAGNATVYRLIAARGQRASAGHATLQPLHILRLAIGTGDQSAHSFSLRNQANALTLSLQRFLLCYLLLGRENPFRGQRRHTRVIAGTCRG